MEVEEDKGNGEETPFIFRSPFHRNERDEAVASNVASIERDLHFIQSHGYDEFMKRRQNDAAVANRNDLDDGEDAATEEDENLGSSFEGSLRYYQIYMLECARNQNAIVHLGTGMGKTLISIFLIKEFLSRRNDSNHNNGASNAAAKSHILFLVPSIALAVQHTDTLRANLSCVVATACHTSSHSPKARADIANADVIVATHGTALDLLRHYPDVLSMSKVDLLVMDECHYATGKHNYATILKDYYHHLPKEDRPRVLGLTASPLINVGVHVNNSQLHMLLTKFETVMDARLFGFPSEILPGGRVGKEAEEFDVSFNSLSDGFNTSLPPTPQWGLLHESRRKEIEQLQQLCEDVGLQVTAVYASTLVHEIGRNEFEQETPTQFETLKHYLISVYEKLNQMIQNGRGGLYGGHTDKMQKLEDLLTAAVKPAGKLDDQQAPVGIVFVERRITAIAICNYFCHKQKHHGHKAELAEDIAPMNGSNCNNVDQRDEQNGQRATKRCYPIRCDVVVRQATQVFKYLGRHNKSMQDEWVHQTKQIRTIIKRLRCRETNLLVATSVVEEGVDVEACSFIVSFDGLKTVKSYIQMKGRARHKNAKFFVFVDSAFNTSQPLSLSNAQTLENIIHTFIAETQREIEFDHLPGSSSNTSEHTFASDEEAAMHLGKYITSMSSVDLSSSKSLLNRYALSVPLEPNCRTSKEATTLHMPIYTRDKLILPSHLPPDVREVNLPIIFSGESKRKKQALLALASCVRLHKLGLFNDRLLPLSCSDMKEWLMKKTVFQLPSYKPLSSNSFGFPCAAYVYSIGQSGHRFNAEEERLYNEESFGMQLALVSLSLLPENLPVYSFHHKQLGQIQCRLSFCRVVLLSEAEWKELAGFHCLLFNSRWRQRRKNTKRFHYNEGLLENRDSAVAPYVIGCVKATGAIDWTLMKKTMNEASRSVNAREEAAQSDSVVSPRIWSPSYNAGVAYIVYGLSDKKCSNTFPSEDYETFRDYYATKYSIDISSFGNMVFAERVWDFPQSLTSKKKVEAAVDGGEKDIHIVELPQELCVENEMANPMIMLHSVMLPQLMYQLERYITATSFIEHCSCNFPILATCLSELAVDSVMEALTAKSCCLESNYDRMEWLGDAVLKLLHTDALLKWTYTSYLHEGYLSMLRSIMGSNDRLNDIAKAAGFDKFILLKPLNRREWCPFGLQYCEADEDSELPVGNDDVIHCVEPSLKVRADVIEAVIGLVFIEFGYEQCTKVACEIGLSFSSGNIENVCRRWSDTTPDQRLLSFACGLLGVSAFSNPHLLVEATTHHSCLHKPVPSYQRLEWVGDAVLCLAAREWLFRRDEKLSVPKLVVLETTLICNCSLAWLGFTKGLHHYIDHRNASYPGRFQSYQLDLEMGRGLWSTDPPKVIPDVIEALIGAVHVDSGLHAGQKSALHVIAPLIGYLSQMPTTESSILTGLLHPKQHLYEMTGGIVSVKVYKEDIFLQLGYSSSLWNFGNDCGDAGFVGAVTCKNIVLATVLETTRLAAVNVACALAVQILTDYPSIISQLHDIRSTLDE